MDADFFWFWMEAVVTLFACLLGTVVAAAIFFGPIFLLIYRWEEIWNWVEKKYGRRE